MARMMPIHVNIDKDATLIVCRVSIIVMSQGAGRGVHMASFFIVVVPGVYFAGGRDGADVSVRWQRAILVELLSYIL